MPDPIVLQIRERLDYVRLYSEYLDLQGSGAERRARCIFHDDSHPSMGVNVEDGNWLCRVPSCGARGDVFDFYMRVRDMTFPQAVDELARRAGLEPPPRGASTGDDGNIIDDAIVDSTHHRLMNTPTVLQWLQEQRGLTTATIQRWKLGHDGSRYYIPIRDELGRLVNIRRYKPRAASHEKMISWRTGFGGARLWPWDSIERARAEGCPIYIMEGELDCLLALQHGLCAITATGGAGTWREVWNVQLHGLDVRICYDVDEPGRVGSHNVAQSLHAAAGSVRIVSLPLSEPAGADFTDYIVGHGHGIEDFLQLAEETSVFQPSAEDDVPRVQQEPVTLHLSQASRAEHYNTPIRTSVVVSGKTTAPYIVPKQVRMSCSMPGLPMCQRCPVAARAGSLQHEFDYEGNEVLQFVDAPDATIEKRMKRTIGIPSRCSIVSADVIEAINVEAVQLIPEIDRSTEEAPYVTRLAYYKGHGLQTNRSYLMTGVTVPTPQKQLVTHIMGDAVPSQSNIDAFRLSPEIIERLKVFQPEQVGSVESLWRKVNQVYADLENMTRIYQRRDLMLAVDLVMHSALTFVFQGEELVRGWTEALFVGDSRTGKTTIVQRMLDYYRAGEFSSGENTTLAGLVGGLHQIGNSWALQWGRIPLNDRRALAIDEVGNLPLDQIARLSSMRSSGVAEIIKVHTERTRARTRQIWISNPREPNPMSSYSQGVLAVKQLIGEPSDIARFDMVVTAASDDVDLSVINAARVADEPHTYTADLCHQRVMWAWSRTPEQVEFTPEAEVLVLQRATQQGMKYQYTTEIPLVEPNEQRVKLARLSVAAAMIFFSASDDGERVIVKREHVDFAFQFLEQLYAKPSLAFDEYAEQRRRSNEVSDDQAVAGVIRRNAGAARQLMEQQNFTQRDLKEILAFDDNDDMRRAVSTLRACGFLHRYGSSYYVKTPAAIRWLRNELASRNGNGAYGVGPAGNGALAPTPPEEPDF